MLPQVVEGDSNSGLGQDARLLEIAIGQVAGHVFRGDDAFSDVFREGRPPESRRLARGEDDPSHAGLCGVNRADGRRVVRDDFGQACGAPRDIASEGFEVVQMVSDVLSDADPVSVRVGDAELQRAEETSRSGDGWAHEPELAQHALPGLKADALATAEGIKNVEDPRFAAVREL